MGSHSDDNLKLPLAQWEKSEEDMPNSDMMSSPSSRPGLSSEAMSGFGEKEEEEKERLLWRSWLSG